VTEEDEPICRTIGPGLFRDVKAWFQSMFHFDEPMDATLVTLFIFQTRCYRLLPTVFYLFIMGRLGSGKTCLLNALRMLGRGLLLGNISVAAMARELGRGREVRLESQVRVARSAIPVMYHLGCFDEFDASGDRDRHAVMEEMLRHGYRADGPGYVRWDLERNKSTTFDLYMPKAAAATSTLNPALASRGFRVSAVPFDSPEGWAILLSNRYPKQVAELNKRLDDWADAVALSFNMEHIEELETSEEHAKRVEAITGGLGLNRKNEHALTCATISYLVGIDIANELKHGIETLAIANEEYEDEIEEINSAILAVAMQQSPIETADSVTLKQSVVKRFINDARDQNHHKPLGNKRFAEAYRAAGIKDSWIRGRGGKNWWVIPMRHLQVLRGLVNSPNSVNLAGNLDQQTFEAGRVDSVDREGAVADGAFTDDNVAVRIRREYDSGATYDDLAKKYPTSEIDRLKIPKTGGREE